MSGRSELYRLNDDADQRNDVATEHPELVREQALLSWHAAIDGGAGELGQRESWVKSKRTKKQRQRLRALGYAE